MSERDRDSAARLCSPYALPFEPYYDRDGITIYNADCRKVLPFLDRFDLLLTDPPYGIGFAAQPTRYQRINGLTKQGWDSEPPQVTIDQTLRQCDNAIIWGGNYFDLQPTRGWLIWSKTGNAPSMADAELAWTSRDMNTRVFHKSVKSASLEKNLKGAPHPTQKPLALMQWCLGFFTDAETVLDPFMGSGTTLVAAKLEGRRAVGIEISEKYCEAAANRLSQGTLF
jgi:DNA modification methylase